MESLELHVEPGQIDLVRNLAPLRSGAGDPSFARVRDEVWWARRTPEGPATTRFLRTGSCLEITSWGAGAPWALRNAPAAIGLHDDPSDFDPSHSPAMERLSRALRGVRLGAPGCTFETLIRAIAEQRVTARSAKASYRQLVTLYGEPAPGPLPLLLPPTPDSLYELRYPAYHRLGLERRRAETIRSAAAHAARLHRCAHVPFPEARRRLRSIPGVGAWTMACVMRTALGDPDAVIVGDFHLPNAVAWVLADEPRADDTRMLELLAPFKGQRGRAMRLIEASGRRAPKFGPRRRLVPIARL